MTYTINLSQLNAVFGLAMPFVVGLVAGFIRQDGFATWLNELISHLVIILLAIAQTLLGGQWGGSSLANFLLIASLSYGVLSTRFGSQFQSKVQASTSLLKAPPEPPALTLESIAAVIAQQLQAYNVANKPIDQQQTQAYQVVRTNTPPLGG